MKKLFLSLIAAGVVTVNLMASSVEGEVTKVSFLSDGRVYVTITVGSTNTGAFFSDTMDAESKKVFTAAVMTAKAGGITTKGYLNGGMWTSFELK